VDITIEIYIGIFFLYVIFRLRFARGVSLLCTLHHFQPFACLAFALFWLLYFLFLIVSIFQIKSEQIM